VAALLSVLSSIICVIVRCLHCDGLLSYLIICIAASMQMAASLFSTSSPIVWVTALTSASSSIICFIIHHLHCVGLLRHLVVCVMALTSAAVLSSSVSSPVVWVAALLSVLLPIVCVVVRCQHCNVVVCADVLSLLTHDSHPPPIQLLYSNYLM
jgi:hypothetical protein